MSIALSEGKDIIIEEMHLLERRHSSLLIPKIKEMLEKVDFSIDGVDAFVIGLGPGSFTGMRIGVSAVKGFGIATKKPCVGVASIDAIALNTMSCCVGRKVAPLTQQDMISIVPIIDAKRQQVYSAIYRRRNGRIVKESRHLLLHVEDLMKKIKGHAIFLGDAIGLYREVIERCNKKAVFLNEKYWYPRASNITGLGLAKLKRCKKLDLGKLKPIYLYPKDCQVRKT